VLEAYKATTGGIIADDSVVYTVCAEIAGHCPVLAPHLEDALREAEAKGGPLYLFDLDRAQDPLGDREEAALWEQLERLEQQGTLRRLPTHGGAGSTSDPRVCRMVAQMNVTIKGKLDTTPSEQAAIASGDVAAMSARARERAARAMERLVASPPPPDATPGATLEALLAADLASFQKVRPVANFSAASRGCERLGLAEGGIVPSGCRLPSLAHILQEATKDSWIARIDLRDFFYQLALSAPGSALCCVARRDRRGVLHVWALQGLCMGVSCSPAVGECCTSLLAHICNARGAASTTQAGWHAQMDDLIIVGTRAEVEHACALLEALLDEVGALEAKDKRVVGPVAEVLGKVFDFPGETVGLPPDRLFKYLTTLHLADMGLGHVDPALRREITPALLSKLTGVLAWASELSPGGPAHLRGLYSVTAGARRVGERRDAVLRDLGWWMQAAATGGLTCSMPLGAGGCRLDTVWVDASSTSLGAVTRDTAVWSALAPEERQMSSAQRELRAMLMFLRAQGARLRHCYLALCSDSAAAVMGFNKGRLEGNSAQRDMQECYDIIARYGIRAAAVYLPREYNREADALSKAEDSVQAQAWATRTGRSYADYSGTPPLPAWRAGPTRQ